MLGLFKPKQAVAKTGGSGEFYVAVAIEFGIGQRAVEPGFRWHYATGWSEDSGHEAGQAAEAACSKSSGTTCWQEGISSMKGGCVAMVEGTWRDKDEPQPELDAFVVTNQTREIAESWALGGCKDGIHAGKYKGTVQEYECTLKVSFCSEDVRP